MSEQDSGSRPFLPQRFGVSKELNIADALNRIKNNSKIDPGSVFGDSTLLTEYRGVDGEKPVVVFTNTGHQKELPKLMWGINADKLASHLKPHHIVDVENNRRPLKGERVKPTTARVIYDSSLETESESLPLVSRGLEKRLGTEEGEFIRITNLRPDFSTLNLDERYKE